MPDEPPRDAEPRIGVYVCHCGLNIAGTVDCPAVAQFAATLPGVVRAVDYRYMCSDPGQELLKKDVGVWDAAITTWHEPGAEPMVSKAIETNELLDRKSVV